MSRTKNRGSFLTADLILPVTGLIGIGLIWGIAISFPGLTDFVLKYALPSFLTGVPRGISGRTEATNNVCSWVLLVLTLAIPFYTTLFTGKILYPERKIGAVISRGIYKSFASGEISWQQARVVFTALTLAIVHFMILAVVIDYLY
jgi:hypothetical protein